MGTQWRGAARLGASAAVAAGRVAADAVGERLGRALPRTPGQLVQLEAMRALLGPDVRAARLPGRTFESSNCQNFLVEVERNDGAVQSLYAKMPSRELAPRIFANAIGFWALECTFCDRMASHVPV